MGGKEAETFPINMTMKGKGERLRWLERGVELLFAANSCPGGKDLIEKGKLRIHSEE